MHLCTSGSIFFFQQFGYFLAPILSGAVSAGYKADLNTTLGYVNATERADLIADPAALTEYEDHQTQAVQANVAFFFVMEWALLGWFTLIFARFYAGRAASRAAAQASGELYVGELKEEYKESAGV